MIIVTIVIAIMIIICIITVIIIIAIIINLLLILYNNWLIQGNRHDSDERPSAHPVNHG